MSHILWCLLLENRHETVKKQLGKWEAVERDEIIRHWTMTTSHTSVDNKILLKSKLSCHKFWLIATFNVYYTLTHIHLLYISMYENNFSQMNNKLKSEKV